jgi:hypothetical protein
LLADRFGVLGRAAFGIGAGRADNDAFHGIVGGPRFEVIEIADLLLLGRLLEATAAPKQRAKEAHEQPGTNELRPTHLTKTG